MKNSSAQKAPRDAGLQANKPVFFGSAFLVLATVICAVLFHKKAQVFIDTLQSGVIANFGWFYMLSVGIILIFSILLAFSSYGQIKLGADHTEPDFSLKSWIAMLFSAGMGIGLLFFGVAEPIMHYIKPPVGDARSIQAARQALSITFFHWGLHAWAVYAVVGLILAYFGFRHNLPLSMRSAFFPLLKGRIHGAIGHGIDICAVMCTMFGIATSLGLGVIQVNMGLNYLFGLPFGTPTQLVLIMVITLIATWSVVSGLDAGVKRLSEINLLLAVILLLYVFFAGPTIQLLQLFVQNIGIYLDNITSRTFNLYAYEPSGWIGGWTLFYWGWWLSWSPFVGMFIAKISRGRTIREFVTGVLLFPVAFTFLWMTVFGNSGIIFEAAQPGIISDAVSANVEIALFKFFEQLPGTQFLAFLAVVLIITFFVTSADSGALVIDIITSGDRASTPVWQKVFWALLEGVVACVLLYAGGLKALQTVSIVCALPLAGIILLACHGLLSELRLEGLKRMAIETSHSYVSTAGKVPWKKRLQMLIRHPNRSYAEQFLASQVHTALKDVSAEYEARGLKSSLEFGQDKASITVSHGDEMDFHYSVHLKQFLAPSFALTDRNLESPSDEARYFRAEVYLSKGGQRYDIMGFTYEQIIADIISQYDRHLQFLHFAR